MKIGRFATIGIVVLVWTSGCAAPAPAVSPSAPAPAPTVEKQDEIQNSREREMVIVFQILVQMDKKENLVISSNQAQNLLPLIRRYSSEGGLTQADQTAILAQLNGEQRQYVDDYQERIRKRIKEFKELKERSAGLSHEERESMIREFQSRRQHEQDGDWPPPRPPRNTEEGSAGQAGGAGGPAPPAGGMNVEHQLLDLLESKVSKSTGK